MDFLHQSVSNSHIVEREGQSGHMIARGLDDKCPVKKVNEQIEHIFNFWQGGKQEDSFSESGPVNLQVARGLVDPGGW